MCDLSSKSKENIFVNNLYQLWTCQHGSSENVDTIKDFETDVQSLDQGAEGEEHEGEHEGNPEAKDIVKYYRYLLFSYFQIIIFNHYECYNKHTVTLRHFL